MSRVVITTAMPDPSVYRKGDVIEVTAAQQAAIGAGNLRATVYRDQTGESAGASNSN